MENSDLFSLAGLTAVVVGGGGVLAGAMAAGLARAGADIAIVDVNLENAEARAKSIVELGRQAIGIRCDATARPIWRSRWPRCCRASGAWIF